MAGCRSICSTDSAVTFAPATHGATEELRHALQRVIRKLDLDQPGDAPKR